MNPKRRIITFFTILAVLLIAGCSYNSTNDRSNEKQTSIFKLEGGIVDGNGVLIYYKMFGNGQPLLIVHGGPGASHDYFLPYFVPLALTNKLIFIDERGSGQSQ